MWSRWWALPGPSAFIDGIVNTLRTGQNLVIALPEHAPPGLADEVARRVDSDPIWRWRRLFADQNPVDLEKPADFIIEHLLTEKTYSHSSAVDTLTHMTEMRDRVLWIESIPTEQWPDWRMFLSNYAQTCRTLPQLGRGLICCMVTSVAQEELPQPDVALSVKTWTNRLDELDIQIWAAHLLRGDEFSALERRAHRALISGLAGFDPILASRLANLELESLAYPYDLLIDMATERGWTRSDYDSPCWENGTFDRVGGTPQIHPAVEVLVPEDAQRHIHARVWQAQVAVVFPFIELKRREILSKFHTSLTVPFDKGDGNFVLNPEDLEINHLYHQLRYHRDPRIEPFLRQLRNARNALAHLEVISGPDLLSLFNDI